MGSQDFPSFGRFSLQSQNECPENETGSLGNPALPHGELVWPLDLIQLTKEGENIVSEVVSFFFFFFTTLNTVLSIN